MRVEALANDAAGTRAEPAAWLILLYLGIAVLYGCVGYSSAGYDDEFTNIELIERLGGGVLSYVQGNDVHPPGSYLLDWLLFAALRDWQLVRLAVALFTSGAIVYAVEWLRQRHGMRAATLALVLLALNPALLMWCTGLRWYAWFVPLLLWLVCPPPVSHRWYWIKCCFGLLALAFLGYAAFLVALPVLLIYWRGSPQPRAIKSRAMVLYGGAALLLYAYQLSVFLMVHAPNKEGQTSGLLAGLVGFFIAQVGNQGVFPVSPAGVLGALGTLGMAFTVFQSGMRAACSSMRLQSYALASALFLLTGLAGKFRNLVLLSPLQALWFATAEVAPRRARQFLVFVSCAGLANLSGVINVVTHADTTKNGWNIPVRQLLMELSSTRAACGGDLVVLTYDRMLAWQAAHAGFVVISPFAARVPDSAMLRAPHRCVTVINTFAGGIPPETLRDYQRDLGLLTFDSETRSQVGRDRYFALKRHLDLRYPEFLVEKIDLHEVRGLERLRSWLQSQPMALHRMAKR